VRRLRLLRVVLALLLVGLVVAIGVAVRSRPARRVEKASETIETGARAEGFRFSDIVGDHRRLLVSARLGHMDDQGAFTVEDVERVEVEREGGKPFALAAARGAGSGAQGKRVVRLEGGVTFEDPDLGAKIAIPTVEIDQVAGVVRSVGDVRIEGDRVKGSASAIVYSLRGEPTQVFSLALDGVPGEHVDARHAVITSGTRLVTLEGDVHARQGGTEVAAERFVLTRGESGKLESADGSPSVMGHAPSLAGGSGSFAARELHAAWDPAGRLTSLTLVGDARVEHARGILAADRVEATAVADGPGAAILAAGTVIVTGVLREGPGRLACDSLSGVIGEHGEVRDGVATGHVRFDGEGAAGEAARMTFSSLAASGTATLFADGESRARLANGRTRVAADTIVSDLKGIHLIAQGRVESTLLSDPSAKASGVTPPMFTPGDAVHFVSASLESFEGGQHLLFKGDVRGWQGDRMLSGEEVDMVQEGQKLVAHGHVATRMPREAGKAASDADYVQVVADRLTYKGAAHTAEYEGAVRVRQAEGWLEAPHLVARLGETGGGVQEVTADGGVRFEYRAPGAQGIPTTATGEGDRATYDTAARVVRLFGDARPATVRGSGPNPGTTVGRVLRYQLDTGGLEVESGERERATIKTPKS
jgi:lipopolysaccharide transport protein LptA